MEKITVAKMITNDVVMKINNEHKIYTICKNNNGAFSVLCSFESFENAKSTLECLRKHFNEKETHYFIYTNKYVTNKNFEFYERSYI